MLTLTPVAPAHAEFEFLAEWGAPGPGDLAVPFDVERDAAGNVYVVDPLTGGVHKFDAANAAVQKLGSLGSGPGQFTFPTAIGLNVGNGEFYVAEIGGLGSSTPTTRIQRFDASGAYLGEFGSLGTAEGQFGFVRGISVDSNGNVFVADTDLQPHPAVRPRRPVHPHVGQGRRAGWRRRLRGAASPAVRRASRARPRASSTRPTDVAASAFGIFVSDSDNNRIQRFNLAGGQVNFLLMGGRDVQPGGAGGYETCSSGCKAGAAGSGVGELDGPEGLDTSASLPGRVWISDGNERIQRYNLGLTHETQFGGPGTGDGQFESPQGLAEQGGQVVVVDSALSRFQRFDGDTGAFQSKSSPPAPATLILPQGIGAGPGGIYVSDIRDRVARFDSSGGFLGAFGTAGNRTGPVHLTGRDQRRRRRNVYVTDRGNDRVQRLDALGNTIGAWGSPGFASGEFERPVDIATAPDGSVFVVEQGNHRVQKFSPIGGFRGTWGAEGSADGAFDDPSGSPPTPMATSTSRTPTTTGFRSSPARAPS